MAKTKLKSNADASKKIIEVDESASWSKDPLVFL